MGRRKVVVTKYEFQDFPLPWSIQYYNKDGSLYTAFGYRTMSDANTDIIKWLKGEQLDV